jgi:hypothetical protein
MMVETPGFTLDNLPTINEHMLRVKSQPRIKAYEDARGDLSTLAKAPHRPHPPMN